MSDCLIILYPQGTQTSVWEPLLRRAGEGSGAIPVDPSDELGACRAALEKGADYVLFANSRLSQEQFQTLWQTREDGAVHLGDAARYHGFWEKLNAWLLKAVNLYSFSLYLQDGCPAFLFLPAAPLREYLDSLGEELPAGSQGVLAAAAYAGAALEWTPCETESSPSAGRRFRSLLFHPFHSLKRYKQVDSALRERYGVYRQRAEERQTMRLPDKLLAIINRETVSYVIFGLLTTIVNLIVFRLCDMALGEKLYLLSNVIAWVFAVAFAYVTNKLLVFQSKSWKLPVVMRELPSFIGARLFSLGVEEAGLFLFVHVMAMGSFAAKVILQVIVVILNYFFSKLFVFKAKK